MKINSNGEIVIPAKLVKKLGLKPGDEAELEMNRDGILVKTERETAESIMKWLREEHGDEMTTLTTAQILQLLK